MTAVSDVTDVLSWNDDDIEFDVRQFVHKFSSRLPLIVHTTSGFTALTDPRLHEVGVDELYWVTGIQQQRRVVARSDGGIYVSIPLNYDRLFHRVSADTSAVSAVSVDERPVRLTSLLQAGMKSGHRLIHASSSSSSSLSQRVTTVDMRRGHHHLSQLGVIELVDEYTELYLLAHALLNGELQCEVVVIHVYLPITLRVATGFKSRDSTAFSLWTRALSRLATSFCQQQQQPVLLCQEMLVFDSPPVSRDYAYQRQSCLIDSWSAMSHQLSTAAEAFRVRRCLEMTSQMTRPPQMSTRPRRQTDTQTHRQTDRQTPADYATIDDLRREVVTYCTLTKTSDTKRMTRETSDYENIEIEGDGARNRPRFASDSELSSTTGSGRRAGEKKCGSGKRRFCYKLFAKSSGDDLRQPRRSKSSSPIRDSATSRPSC